MVLIQDLASGRYMRVPSGKLTAHAGMIATAFLDAADEA
jgi:hypothetical protein